MRISWKKLSLLGIVLIALGLSVIVFLTSLSHIETVNQNTFDLSTKQSYYSDRFRAESGYWLDLDIATNGASAVHVSGQVVGEIFKVEGTAYKYSVRIPQGDVYQVQVENKMGHYEWLIIWTPDENHFSGNFYLKRNAWYVLPSYITAFALVGVGSLVLAFSVMGYQKDKRKAELSRKCPQCGQTVAIDKTLCPYCGFDVTKSVRCKHCDALYDSSLYKCPHCGAKRE